MFSQYLSLSRVLRCQKPWICLKTSQSRYFYFKVIFSRVPFLYYILCSAISERNWELLPQADEMNELIPLMMVSGRWLLEIQSIWWHLSPHPHTHHPHPLRRRKRSCGSVWLEPFHVLFTSLQFNSVMVYSSNQKGNTSLYSLRKVYVGNKNDTIKEGR